MPFVTHFKDTDGQQLPIAASTLVTVEIPAAGSADKGGWMQAAQDTTEHYNQQAGHDAPKSSAVIPHCTDPSVFTDHGLRIDYEEQLQGWVLWIDSLPETACTLTLLFINHSTEDTPCVFPAGGGTETQKAIDLNAYGIDIATVAFNGGGLFTFDIDHQGFWSSIPTNGRFVVKANYGDGKITVVPQSLNVSQEGVISAIDFALVLYMSAFDYLVKINIKLMSTYDRDTLRYIGTQAAIVIEQMAIPQLN